MLCPVRVLAVTVVALVAVVTGCTGDAVSNPKAATTATPATATATARATATLNCVDPAANPVTVVTQPELAESSRDAANLVLQITNSATVSAHLRVTLDGELAVDDRLPAARPSECSSSPIYQWHYKLPAGRAILTATREGEPPETLTFRVIPERRWVVIDAQRGLPLEPRLFKDEPMWG